MADPVMSSFFRSQAADTASAVYSNSDIIWAILSNKGNILLSQFLSILVSISSHYLSHT